MTPQDIQRLIQKDENGLLPCRCGAKPRLREHPISQMYPSHEVSCPKCFIKAWPQYNKKDAKEKWNRSSYTKAIQTLLSVIEKQHEALKMCANANTLEQYVYSREQAEKAIKLGKPFMGLGKQDEPQ